MWCGVCGACGVVCVWCVCVGGVCVCVCGEVCVCGVRCVCGVCVFVYVECVRMVCCV